MLGEEVVELVHGQVNDLVDGEGDAQLPRLPLVPGVARPLLLQGAQPVVVAVTAGKGGCGGGTLLKAGRGGGRRGAVGILLDGARIQAKI